MQVCSPSYNGVLLESKLNAIYVLACTDQSVNCILPKIHVLLVILYLI